MEKPTTKIEKLMTCCDKSKNVKESYIGLRELHDEKKSLIFETRGVVGLLTKMLSKNVFRSEHNNYTYIVYDKNSQLWTEVPVGELTDQIFDIILGLPYLNYLNSILGMYELNVYVQDIIATIKQIGETIKMNHTYGEVLAFDDCAYDISTKSIVQIKRKKGPTYKFHVDSSYFTESKNIKITRGIKSIVKYTQFVFGKDANKIRRHLKELVTGQSKNPHVVLIIDKYGAVTFFRKLNEMFDFAVPPCNSRNGPLFAFIISGVNKEYEDRFLARLDNHDKIAVIFTDKVGDFPGFCELQHSDKTIKYESKFQHIFIQRDDANVFDAFDADVTPCDMFAWIFIPQSKIQECTTMIKKHKPTQGTKNITVV
jgi:hypothetical protein